MKSIRQSSMIHVIRRVLISLALTASVVAVCNGKEKGEDLLNTNRLRGSGSPYLEQHADNPVHWQPWSDEVFDLAGEADKPVLVSIGYSTCHWCHVMAHESFEDEQVAEVMNRFLVPIKVDREQHPGVDSVYMEAAQALTGSGGWPLNVFVDLEGRPFLAVTYLPPDRWSALVTEVGRIWAEDRGRIDDVVASLSNHLSERDFPPENNPGVLPGALREGIAKVFDPENPGFIQGGGNPMKFPPSQAIDWMLEYGSEDDREKGIAILTAMMDSGLHDRVSGGFHRYSVDPIWRVPHFEKMTYDNAQLLGLYSRSSLLVEDSGLSADLLTTARGIADWFLREMRVYSVDGEFQGYATATDADDALGEGSYFAWPPSALEAALGAEDAAWLARRWHISGDGRLPGPAEGGHYEPKSSWIPHPRGAEGYPEAYRSPGVQSAGESDRQREERLIILLRSAREGREAPIRDDKVLSDQNALVLEGFVRLARYTSGEGGSTYLEAAGELAELLAGRVETQITESSTLMRTEDVPAYITDYGYLAMALTGAYGLFGNPGYARAAEIAAREAEDKLATGRGSYYSVPEERKLFKRPIEEFDGPSPAGQHALGIAFGRLYTITGDRHWKERARDLLVARGAVGRVAATGAPTLVRLASLYEAPYSLVVTGPSGNSRTAELVQMARRIAGPDLMVIPADLSAESGGAEWAELQGRIGLTEPELLVCREGSCLLPASSDSEVLERLRQIDQWIFR